MSIAADSVNPVPLRSDTITILAHIARKISTKSETAQIWFNRGLIWCYSFSHEEAYKCFEQTDADDRKCAMAYWGLAYAAGPNYNKPWRLYVATDLTRSMKICNDAVHYVLDVLGTASLTPVERALIEAMQARYPIDHPIEDYDPINHAYDHAMANVHSQFPDDLDGMGPLR